MPPSRRRPLRDFLRHDRATAAVETALILSLTAVMVYSVKTVGGVAALTRPAHKALTTLIEALS